MWVRIECRQDMHVDPHLIKHTATAHGGLLLVPH